MLRKQQQHKHQCSVNMFRNKNIINPLKNFIISIMIMRAVMWWPAASSKEWWWKRRLKKKLKRNLFYHGEAHLGISAKKLFAVGKITLASHIISGRLLCWCCWVAQVFVIHTTFIFSLQMNIVGQQNENDTLVMDVWLLTWLDLKVFEISVIYWSETTQQPSHAMYAYMHAPCQVFSHSHQIYHIVQFILNNRQAVSNFVTLYFCASQIKMQEYSRVDPSINHQNQYCRKD